MGMMEKLNELTSSGAREYLTFRLDQEEYGIDILKVQEIRGYEPPTRVANAPNFIKGVVNLRGTIVPIVDMRLKFNCSKAEYNTFTVVIVLNLRSRIVGIVVDSVSDVMELPADSIKPAPDLDSVIDSGAVVGLGSLGDRMLILLDIERLIKADQTKFPGSELIEQDLARLIEVNQPAFEQKTALAANDLQCRFLIKRQLFSDLVAFLQALRIIAKHRCQKDMDDLLEIIDLIIDCTGKGQF